MTTPNEIEALQGIAAVMCRYDVRIGPFTGRISLFCLDCEHIPAQWRGPVSMPALFTAMTDHSIREHPGKQG